MAATQTQTQFDIYSTLKTAVNLLTDSGNAQDLCRRATHSEFFKGMCRGTAIFLLDQKSALIQVAGYGDIPDGSQIQTFTWDDHFLASSVRSRTITYELGESGLKSSLPIETAGVITGAILFSFSTDYEPSKPDFEFVKLLSKLAGLFMDTKGISFTPRVTTAVANESGDVSSQEMTTRQVRILHYIADGLTNAEISKHVLLSESTVRQETIRIFRILKCHTRSEAIVKSRALGITARIPNDIEPNSED